MAIVCPTCGHSNPPGTLICAKCFTLVVQLAQKGAGTTVISQETLQSDSAWQISPEKRTRTPNKETIALYFNSASDPLLVNIEDQVIVGRYSVQNNTQPRVDLEPYGASDMGVSRVHMLLRRTSKGLTVEDMASSNGTWLNGIRLRPYTASPLKSGDRLRLGSMEIEVQFGVTNHW